jgi:O-antigen/teichoic acid export membrane protein
LTALSGVVMAVSYSLYLRRLGYEQYGLWLILSTVVAFSQVGNLGISQAVAKKVAEFWPDGHIREIKAYAGAASLIVCVSGVLIICAVLAIRTEVAALLHLSASNTKLLIKLLPAVALFSVYLFVVDISNATLNGLGRLDLCATCQTAAQLLGFVFSLGLLRSGAGVEALLIGSAAGYAFAHLLSLYFGWRTTGHVLFGFRGVQARHARSLLGFGSWIFGSAVLNLLLTPINRGLLARFGGVALVPLYDIPFNSCMRVRSLLENSQRALIAEVSALKGAEQERTSRRLRQLSGRAFKVILLAAPLFLLLALCADPILKIWLGQRYEPAMTRCFQTMALGALAGTLGVPAYYILLGLGQAAAIFRANLAQAASNLVVVALVLACAHSLSALSLSMSASIGMAAGGVLLIWQQKRIQELVNC